MERNQKYFNIYNKRELIIATLSVVSVIISILFYLVIFSSDMKKVIYLFDLVITGILAFDFFKSMRKSKNYKKFLIDNLYEIPALIPLIFFSFIQYQSSTVALFRAFNLIPVFRLLILLRLMSLFKAAKHLKARPFIYLIILFISSTIFGAIGMLVVEEANPHSTIKNLGDAFWFAITTLTISGFGDVVPVTAMGRVISVILILVGLTSILGFISNFGIDVIEDRLNKKLGANENKQYIKNRIDILEQLHASEVEALINEINSLHQKIYNGNISCIKCGFLYPKDSVYCNKCGNKIK